MSKVLNDYFSLAVSGQCCSGKSTLCKILSRKLKWTHVDVGNEFRKLAKIRGIGIEKFGSIGDKLLRQIDDQICQRIQTEANTIWDGRLTCYLAHNNTKIFKVYCIADLNVRSKRCASRDTIPFKKAKSKVLARDIEEADVFERLYGFSNPYNTKWVNLRLNTSFNSPEELANIVMRALCTPRKRESFEFPNSKREIQSNF